MPGIGAGQASDSGFQPLLKFNYVLLSCPIKPDLWEPLKNRNSKAKRRVVVPCGLDNLGFECRVDVKI